MTDAEDARDDGFPIDRDLLRALLAHIDEVIITCRPDGTITFLSPAARVLLGYEPRGQEGSSLLDFVHPEEQAEVIEAMLRWSDRSGTPRGEVQRIRAVDGTWVPLHYDVVVGPLSQPFGGYVVTLRTPDTYDEGRRTIWQRLLNEDRLVRLATVFMRRSFDDFDAGLEDALRELAGLEWVTRVSVWTVDRDDPQQVSRRAFWEAQVNAPTLPLPPAIPVRATTVMRRLSGGEEVHIRSVDHLPEDWEVDREALRMAGIKSLLAVPMHVEDRFTGFVMAEVTLADIAFDVTQIATLRSAAAILASGFDRHETERELAQRAWTDDLTGLPNRWSFLQEYNTAFDEPLGDAGVAVTMVDLDRFTVVNDAFGHDVGDRILSGVADRLRHALAFGDSLFRLHGDEFLVITPRASDATEAAERARPLLAALEPPFQADGRAVQITGTAGVVFTDDPRVTGTEMIQRADLVMQEARALGTGRVGVEGEALHVAVAERIHQETELRAALEAGMVQPWYQGEWDLETGALVGAEALARWNDPERGWVEACDFIAIAEESGFIADLGAQILRTAVLDAAEWPDQLGIRVNISARQLHEVDLLGLVQSAIDDAGLDPTRLCLELTETALLVDPAHAVGVLDAMRTKGVGLAIDDFGTGYSSLLYLKRLPVTSLKIDRSFVTGLPINDDDRAIVRAVIQLAETLGISVTAEGVETHDQRDALLELGCTRAQGYLLSRPEPAADFLARVSVRQD